jgi:glyoxylase I family protein
VHPLRLHHVAVICSNYEASRHFYTSLLGLRVVAENYRSERQSHKLDLALPDGSQIELFSFPNPPDRPTRPEACGLRHLAFAVEHLNPWVERLWAAGVPVEDIRTDEFTDRRFVFCQDPDGLPIELYEVGPAEP